MRSIAQRLFVTIVASLVFSCGGDEPGADCTGPLCPYVGEWKLDYLEVDGDHTGDDLHYELILQPPTDDPSSADFYRNFSDGTSDNGTWTILEGENAMIINGVEEERYTIEESGSDFLVLLMHRKSPKPGPYELKYFFVK